MISFALVDVRNRLRMSMKVVVVVCELVRRHETRDADNFLGLYRVGGRSGALLLVRDSLLQLGWICIQQPLGNQRLRSPVSVK